MCYLIQYSQPCEVLLWWFPLHRCKNWGRTIWNNFPRVTELVALTEQTQAGWLQSSCWMLPVTQAIPGDGRELLRYRASPSHNESLTFSPLHAFGGLKVTCCSRNPEWVTHEHMTVFLVPSGFASWNSLPRVLSQQMDWDQFQFWEKG